MALNLSVIILMTVILILKYFLFKKNYLVNFLPHFNKKWFGLVGLFCFVLFFVFKLFFFLNNNFFNL